MSISVAVASALLSSTLSCPRDVADVDVVFSEFQEGPVYTTGQTVSRGNIAKALAKFTR